MKKRRDLRLDLAEAEDALFSLTLKTNFSDKAQLEKHRALSKKRDMISREYEAQRIREAERRAHCRCECCRH